MISDCFEHQLLVLARHFPLSNSQPVVLTRHFIALNSQFLVFGFLHTEEGHRVSLIF